MCYMKEHRCVAHCEYINISIEILVTISSIIDLFFFTYENLLHATHNITIPKISMNRKELQTKLIS